MGMTELSYYSAYFISDGIVVGFALSLLCAIMTVGGQFDKGDFGAIFGMFFVFCLSAVPFAFFLSTFLSSSQTASQLTLAVLFVNYLVPIVMVLTGGINKSSLSPTGVLSICCLFPPMALQIGCLSFNRTGFWPDDYLKTSSICAFMLLDCVIYSFLAWYMAQVIPSPVG